MWTKSLQHINHELLPFRRRMPLMASVWFKTLCSPAHPAQLPRSNFRAPTLALQPWRRDLCAQTLALKLLALQLWRSTFGAPIRAPTFGAPTCTPTCLHHEFCHNPLSTIRKLGQSAKSQNPKHVGADGCSVSVTPCAVTI